MPGPRSSNRRRRSPCPPSEGRCGSRMSPFSYGEGSAILQDINLAARTGEVVALLGATGSGQDLHHQPDPPLLRCHRRPGDGGRPRRARCDPAFAARADRHDLPGSDALYGGTIAENIAFGRADASMDDIERAAKAAQAHDFVMSFPNGYQTQVGERGATLSGGQRQRLTIARALLLDCRILIMDDSTSSVDVETEYLIQQALAEAMRNRTCFRRRPSPFHGQERAPHRGVGRGAHRGRGHPRGAHGPWRALPAHL